MSIGGDERIRRLIELSEHRRAEAERSLAALQAAMDIADAIGGVSELDRVLELIVERGRGLVNARSILIMLREGDELCVAASAGEAAADARGHRLPIAGSTSGQVLLRGRATRLTDVASHLLIAPAEIGMPDAHTALIVPMLHRDVGIGVLAAFDRGTANESFTSADEQLLRAFAASAANAVAIKRSVDAERLRVTIAAAEAERGRWARELHDQTLQSLGGLRVLLASALRRGDGDLTTLQRAVTQAIDDIQLEADNLRGIIADLRPSLLDDLGLVPAIEALLDRRRQAGLPIVSRLRLTAGEPALPAELETTVYRLVQEALTNVARHARATVAEVSLEVGPDAVVEVVVSDDGVGFAAQERSGGFGLQGMRERVYLLNGTLLVSSGADGTTVRARLPLSEGRLT